MENIALTAGDIHTTFLGTKPTIFNNLHETLSALTHIWMLGLLCAENCNETGESINHTCSLNFDDIDYIYSLVFSFGSQVNIIYHKCQSS